MKYLVINQDGKILRSGITTSTDLAHQAKSGEYAIAISDNDERVIRDDTHKFDFATNNIIELNQVDLDDIGYERVKNKKPKFTGQETDEQINQIITSFYFGKIDPISWKVENYRHMRRFFYPKIEDFIDAQVKISSQDEALNIIGQAETQAHMEKCLDVKKRFQKPK